MFNHETITGEYKMTLIKYRHRRPAFFQNDVNRIFDQLLTFPASSSEESNWLPAFDVRENKDQLICLEDLVILPFHLNNLNI